MTIPVTSCLARSGSWVLAHHVRRIGPMLIANQSRNTYVLRRKHPPPLRQPAESKLLVGPVLRGDLEDLEMTEDPYHIMEVDEAATSTNKERRHPPKLRVILVENVPGIGGPGSVVDVERDYGRLELICGKKAVYASPFNLAYFKEMIEEAEKHQDTPSSELSPVTKQRLMKTAISVLVSLDTEWTLEPWNLRTALRRAGLKIMSDESVILPDFPISGPDLEGKENKDFAAWVVINKREKVPVRFTIHHMGIPRVENWNRYPREYIFPQQKELLDSLPHEEYLKNEIVQPTFTLKQEELM